MSPSLKESIIILARIKNQLLNAKEGISYLLAQKIKVYNSSWDNDELSKIDTAMFGLIHYSFIWYVAFLDEYGNFFKSANSIEMRKVILVKSACQDYLDNIIKIFGDIKTARNRILAHGYRNNKNIALTNQEVNDHFNRLIDFENVETYTQLFNTLNLVISAIENEFGKIREDDISL